MLILTIAGGLASTVFVPITFALLAVLDWRAAYLVLAGILAVVTIPLHLLLPTREAPATTTMPSPAGRRHVVGSRRFVLLAAGITAMTFSSYAVTLNLLPLIAERGHSDAVAALALALVGVGQVAGRIALTVLIRVVPAQHRPFMVGMFVAISLVLFAIVPGPVWLIAVVSLLAGAVRGAMTLVQAAAVPARWGTERLGILNGVFAAPITAATALAPVAGVALAAGLTSYSLATAVFAGIALAGGACAFLADRRAPWPIADAMEQDQQARLLD